MSKVISVEHPSYLLGKLQEQIFMLRRFADHANMSDLTRSSLHSYAISIMDTALQLTVSVNEQEKAYQSELRQKENGNAS